MTLDHLRHLHHRLEQFMPFLGCRLLNPSTPLLEVPPGLSHVMQFIQVLKDQSHAFLVGRAHVDRHLGHRLGMPIVGRQFLRKDFPHAGVFTLLPKEHSLVGAHVVVEIDDVVLAGQKGQIAIDDNAIKVIVFLFMTT